MVQVLEGVELAGRIAAEEWRGGRRVGLRSWLLTTKSRDVAERVSELYQGAVVRTTSGGDLHVRKLHARGIMVTVARVAHVRRRLTLENQEGLVHACDGSRVLPPMPEEGKPCGCPDDLFARRAAARSGAGPSPDTRLAFCLAAAPELGCFSFQSSAWQLYESLESVIHASRRADGPVQMELALREQRKATRSGLDVSFTYPEVHSVRRTSMVKSDLHLAA
ncbi:recombination directionality factor [Streptomyces olivaceus]|uniref:recombination directionality factor n=1 Tax=Streptomyces olivaceus TaxID=47716 RepID=UPI0036E922D4